MWWNFIFHFFSVSLGSWNASFLEVGQPIPGVHLQPYRWIHNNPKMSDNLWNFMKCIMSENQILHDFLFSRQVIHCLLRPYMNLTVYPSTMWWYCLWFLPSRVRKVDHVTTLRGAWSFCQSTKLPRGVSGRLQGQLPNQPCHGGRKMALLTGSGSAVSRRWFEEFHSLFLPL